MNNYADCKVSEAHFSLSNIKLQYGRIIPGMPLVGEHEN